MFLTFLQTTIHMIKLRKVLLTESNALSNLCLGILQKKARITFWSVSFLTTTYLRYNSRQSVLAERIRPVVHHTAVVITHAKVRHYVCRIDVEVVLHTILNVLEQNIDKLVPVTSTLLVVEPKRMEELVHDRGQPEASRFRCARIQMQLLELVTHITNPGPTAWIFVTNHAHVRFTVIGLTTSEPEARSLLQRSKPQLNVGYLLRSYE